MAWFANPERYEQMLYRFALTRAIAGFMAQFWARSGAGFTASPVA